MTLNTIKKGPFKGMVLLVNDKTKGKSVLWPDDAVKEINAGARVVEEKEWDAFKTRAMLDKETKTVPPAVEAPDFSILDLPGTRKVVKTRSPGKFYAETREFESGWGNKRDDLLEFDSPEERTAWVTAYNGKHNPDMGPEARTPAWYMVALIVE